MATEDSEDEVGKNNASEESSDTFDVIIIGAGAAGVGAAIALAHAGVEDFLLVDRDVVGSSFASWPKETRFITPSFPSNSIGMLDLNSTAIGISPAFSMKVEHPNGAQYASHLQGLADYFELPISENTDVEEIQKIDEMFHITTSNGMVKAKNIIWAAGEFQYPRLSGFVGSELCRHTASVTEYSNLPGDDFIIIGGYESGIDAAYHLARCGKKIRVFDKNSPWGEGSSDPSISLATFTFERMLDPSFESNVELYSDSAIKSVTLVEENYHVTTSENEVFQSKVKPLLASGFEGSHKFVSHLFEKRDDGFPLLSDQDESTIIPGMYLCGPSVRHDNHDFCFIFKYRQRFGVVAESIASSLGIETEEFVEAYRGWGMYLDDLSCCGQECLTC